MSRRNVADQKMKDDEAQRSGDEAPSEPAAGYKVPYTPRRPSKAKRDRSWEKKKRETVGVAAYRGIPPELNQAIKNVAAEQRVRIGDVARRFLEYALDAYECGELKLEPETGPDGRLTLYPAE